MAAPISGQHQGVVSQRVHGRLGAAVQPAPGEDPSRAPRRAPVHHRRDPLRDREEVPDV